MPTAKKTAKPKSPSKAVDAQLARYRSMRDFSVTSEPSGKPQANQDGTKYPFCIQKHAASHLHYDFRLGWNGVLKSWACAKGPSYNVKDRRLAVQVEDHPIEYGGFEGIIPAGQYGGGTVMLWDQGTWEPQPESSDVDKALHEGHLKFILHGTKMKGKWALIRMAPGPKETKPNWLLIKEHDEFERPADTEPITESEPNSVITSRTIDQIAANQDHVWQSNRPEKQPTKPSQNRVPHPRGARVGSNAANPEVDLKSLPKESQPTFLKPQLAQETQTPPEGPTWLHELKLDGYRIQARKQGPKVQLLTRSGLDWTARMPAIANEVAKLPVESITLDGEVVVLAPDGTTNFADLQAAFQEGARNPLTYFCFDLLHLNGRNPRVLPLLERKKLLEAVLMNANPDHLRFSEHIIANGAAMFHKACELHAEGIVSKRADAPYSASRSSAWLKSKCLHQQEFVIGGYTLPGKGNAGGPGLGALLLGYYDETGKNLIYAGRTGTGFSHNFAAELRKRLHALETKSSPFLNPSAEARRGALWVKPTLVAQVRFATWTAGAQVRQAAFLGLREDKPPLDIRRETAAPTPKASRPGNKGSVPHSSQSHRDEWEHPNSLPSAILTPAKPLAAKINPPKTLEHPPVRLTHPDKILDNETHLTKQQLADFYWAVAPRMLPHIADRPLSLVRCPEGSEKPCFFQKHVNAMLPPGIGSVDVADKKGIVEPYITLNTREALAGLAQLGVLEVHPWGSRNEALEQPDRITIDLDPDESLPWAVLTAAALDVRKRLKSLNLESWVKTTGGKGLHVVVPIQPQQEWPAVKEWAHTFVLAMERDNPTLYLTKMTKSARTGKIYLDYLRNERGATAVAPYSPRARKGAPVSIPLAWPELKSETRPTFRVANFEAWSHRLKKDVWADLLKSTQSLK
jgi:bifunctional non-homologous end joining protein LigD